MLTAQEARDATASFAVQRRTELRARLESLITNAIRNGEYYVFCFVPADLWDQVKNIFEQNQYVITRSTDGNMRISWEA
jgi:hypothetical protein